LYFVGNPFLGFRVSAIGFRPKADCRLPEADQEMDKTGFLKEKQP
jgi:hypothetical protein